MKLTQKHKLENYDRIEAERQKLDLAVYDLVNHKFGLAKTYTSKRIREEFDSEYSQATYTVAMSWRGNPLFLVRCLESNAVQCDIWTDTEIQDKYRADSSFLYWRVVMHARNELVAEHMRKEHALIQAQTA